MERLAESAWVSLLRVEVVVPWTVSKKGVHCERSQPEAMERTWTR